MRLHEVELFSKDLEADKEIYQDLFGVKLYVDQQDLSV